MILLFDLSDSKLWGILFLKLFWYIAAIIIIFFAIRYFIKAQR